MGLSSETLLIVEMDPIGMYLSKYICYFDFGADICRKKAERNLAEAFT